MGNDKDIRMLELKVELLKLEIEKIKLEKSPNVPSLGTLPIYCQQQAQTVAVPTLTTHFTNASNFSSALMAFL